MSMPPPDWPRAEASQILRVVPHRWHVQIMGEGPDLLLIHGAGASTHSWRHLLEPLSRNFRVTAFDLPGQGYSTAGTRSRSSLTLMSEDIAALIERLGLQPKVIIGHSAGAALALNLARILPVGPENIIAINGALENFKGATGWLFPFLAKLLVFNPLTGVLLARGATKAKTRQLISSTGAKIDEEGIDLYQRLMSQRSHIEATLAMMAQWSLEDLTRALPDIQIRTLFLHGAQDSAVAPDVARRAAQLMPNASLQLLDGIGHLAQEEAPDQVLEAILSFTNTPPKTKRAAQRTARV